MAQITYTNKQFVNQNANVPVINKVQDSDMNEIKTVVNTNDTNVGDLTNLSTNTKSSIVGAINELKDAEIYSTTETKTNKVWIDGKPIYRKVISLGSLPNATAKTVSTGITNTTIRLVSLTGFCCNATGTYQGGLNDFETRLNLIPSNLINITTKSNFSSFTGYAIMEYTKVAD